MDEIEPADLREYPSLGAFFYRKLKDGVRPVDKAALVSPADGTILHFGTVQESRVEQVKGITYSLDALLGVERTGSYPPPVAAVLHNRDMSIVDDQDFANVNGIEYTLEQLIGDQSTASPTHSPAQSSSSLAGLFGRGSSSSTPSASTSASTSSSAPSTPRPEEEDIEAHPIPHKYGSRVDASVASGRNAEETLIHDAAVAVEMGVKPSLHRRRTTSSKHVKPGNSLFFSVIYLAPGDYHRFHSPTAWVVEKRRHFVGMLSVLLFGSLN